MENKNKLRFSVCLFKVKVRLAVKDAVRSHLVSSFNFLEFPKSMILNGMQSNLTFKKTQCELLGRE